MLFANGSILMLTTMTDDGNANILTIRIIKHHVFNTEVQLEADGNVVNTNIGLIIILTSW